MKNVFIWVAKLILAMLVIVVAVAMFVGAEYAVLFVIDNIGGYSYLDNYDTKKHIALWLLVFLVIQTVSKQMDDIKFNYNKQPKGIYKLLAKWRKERNITKPNYYIYCSNIIEELLEPLYEKEVIKEIQTEIVDKYFIVDYNVDENKIVDTICDIKVFSINELGTMKYNGKKCMKETIKEISSRVQDPLQKEDWAKNGANGKWLKWQEQPKDTLYVANYSKCKI